MCHIRLKKVRKSYFYKLLFLTFAEKKSKNRAKNEKKLFFTPSKKILLFLTFTGLSQNSYYFFLLLPTLVRKSITFSYFCSKKKFLQKITEKVKTLPSSGLVRVLKWLKPMDLKRSENQKSVFILK